MMSKILSACILIVLIVAAIFLRVPGNIAACPECNVILISIDTLRPDHLSAYGYQLRTPAIDQLAEDSVVFNNAIAQAPSTAPSHASIFTSLIPAAHGAFLSRQSSIRQDVPTLPEILKENGYRTGSFNGGGQLGEKFGFGRGFEVYDSFSRSDYENEKFSEKVAKGLTWINLDRTKKFFLFLHSYDIHVPYAPEKGDFLAIFPDYQGTMTLPISDRFLKRVNNKRVELKEPDIRFIKAAYDAEIRSVDRSIGLLVQSLKDEGLYDKTIIILTSDHGEEFGEHGFMGWHSHTLFDELLRIPLIIKLPKQARAGSRVDLQVSSIDILPTILESVGVGVSDTFHGKSLLSSVLGKTEGYSPYAISQKDRGNNLPTSARTLEWKLHKNKLYDLKEDPRETENVAEAHPQKKDELRKVIDEAKKLDSPAGQDKVEMDSEAVDQLKTLGYL